MQESSEFIAFFEDKYVGENGNAAFGTTSNDTRVFLSLHVIYWRTLKADTNIQHRLRAQSLPRWSLHVGWQLNAKAKLKRH